MKEKVFGERLTDGDIWLRALAFVYQSTSRAARKRASKHASALRLLYSEDVDADQIAAIIKTRGGIQKLADEAARGRRSGAKQGEGVDGAEPEASDSEVNAAESGEVCFDISDELAAKIRKWRGNRVKIIARISRKVNGLIKVLKVIKLNSSD